MSICKRLVPGPFVLPAAPHYLAHSSAVLGLAMTKSQAALISLEKFALSNKGIVRVLAASGAQARTAFSISSSISQRHVNNEDSCDERQGDRKVGAVYGKLPNCRHCSRPSDAHGQGKDQ